ncbi:TadE/TadG family type IV pilus assembly protein [Novosphingobium lentum]|uniref:TadE/TadG family type IV pilus assembly protein n=1 Tax=Novosphingobium lentum TaxID=145287 RepID=UPI000835E8A3|nr:TadE/TadG family type IV pilus assembly protein [Novosphingobium lentum]
MSSFGLDETTDRIVHRDDSWLVRLARDRAGNTLAIVAAAIIPLIGMLGSGLDMGRAYLAQSRLQQACDAGALAARKSLGSVAPTSGAIPEAAATIGQRFFNVNFRDGSYGTTDRTFAMALESDYSISGHATVIVPTTLMRIFGFQQVPITVNCKARLNYANTDVMMVLDTTGSMADTNPGDTAPKLQVLRNVVKSFYSQLEASKSPGTRVRYGFVPYSTNVNVGGLLKSGWVADSATYQGRVGEDTGTTETHDTYDTSYAYVSGTTSAVAAYLSATCPANTVTWAQLSYNTAPDGTVTGTAEINGTAYGCAFADSGNKSVTGTTYDHYVYSWTTKKTGTVTNPVFTWRYKPMAFDVRNLKGATDDAPLAGGYLDVPMAGSPASPSPLRAWFRGCMEERATYEIGDYDNVDLTRALDLDLDTIPTSANPDTQWKPMLNEISWVRSMDWNGNGSFTPGPVTFGGDFMMSEWAGLSSCPSPARKLAPMTPQDLSDYVDALQPRGSTYHDIGMIWGGRLLSSTGLFADENADLAGKPTNRNLIFLTDGQTAPLDLSYGAYGIEPLDHRRWSPSSPLSLTEVVEKRFTVACQEVKKRNITVWFVAFGTDLNPVMTQCAGVGHSFSAGNATELETVFSNIAKSMGDLRVSG